MLEVVIDYLSWGIDPNLSVIFVRSLVPELYELTAHFSNSLTLARLERNPTVKDEIRQKGFEGSLPVGFLVYPISQAADITAVCAYTASVGDDQLSVIEQTNEIIRKFRSLYGGSIFLEVNSKLSEVPRLPGIDGLAKISKPLGNSFHIAASPDEIRRAVYLMFIDLGHLKVSDPGKT